MKRLQWLTWEGDSCCCAAAWAHRWSPLEVLKTALGCNLPFLIASWLLLFIWPHHQSKLTKIQFLCDTEFDWVSIDSVTEKEWYEAQQAPASGIIEVYHLLYVYPEQVLSLFKECMRAAQQKPGFEQTVRAEFKRNSALPRSHLVKQKLHFYHFHPQVWHSEDWVCHEEWTKEVGDDAGS